MRREETYVSAGPDSVISPLDPLTGTRHLSDWRITRPAFRAEMSDSAARDPDLVL
ncbi:hypothetical protein GCM10010168_48310 [Actinoplanes ianthinogenes]|nr:hypothetical protein GCM10010168_48310 [Actinoplanes ianthinogenes]